MRRSRTTAPLRDCPASCPSIVNRCESTTCIVIRNRGSCQEFHHVTCVQVCKCPAGNDLAYFVEICDSGGGRKRRAGRAKTQRGTERGRPSSLSVPLCVFRARRSFRCPGFLQAAYPAHHQTLTV